MMTITHTNPKIQEICDAANKYVETKNPEWLQRLKSDTTLAWFDKQIVRVCEDMSDDEICKEEIQAVIESLVLTKYSHFLK